MKLPSPYCIFTELLISHLSLEEATNRYDICIGICLPVRLVVKCDESNPLVAMFDKPWNPGYVLERSDVRKTDFYFRKSIGRVLNLSALYDV